MTITTLVEFRAYLKKKLGYPVLRVCDLTDDQIDICVDETVERFQEHATGYGQYTDLLTISTSGGVRVYDIATNITACVDDINSTNFSGIGELFTTENVLYNAGYFDFESDDIMTLQMVMEHVDLLRTLFGRKYTGVVREATNKLEIWPTPDCTHSGTGAVHNVGTLAFIVTKKYDETKMYNHIWVKEYAFALCQIQIGMNRSKYEGVQLPGGGTLNGALMLSEGKESKEKLMDDLIKNFVEPPDFYIA